MQEHVWLIAIEMSSCQEVCADHFQTVTARFVATEHHGCRFDCLLDYRNSSLINLEVDEFMGPKSFPFNSELGNYADSMSRRVILPDE